MPTARRPSVDRAYALVRPLIAGTCKKFLCRCRMHQSKFWDLMSEANMVFVRKYPEWDPKKAPLDKFVRFHVRVGLIQMIRKEVRRDKLLPRVSAADEVAILDAAVGRQEPPPFSVKRFSWSAAPVFRKDVRAVLIRVFDPDFLNLPSPAACRAALVKHFRREAGWTRRRVEVVFSQIQSVLQGD